MVDDERWLARGVWDAAVVGGGVAGAVAAAELAARGWRVVLLEQAGWPRAKVCGGCMNAAGVSALRAAGLGAALAGGVRLERVVWRAGRQRLELSADGVALSRAELDAGLVALAVERGCAFMPAAAARLLPGEGGAARRLQVRVDGATADLRARVVLACDGINGTLLADEPWAGWRVARDSWMGVALSGPGWPGMPAAGTIAMHIGVGGYVGIVRLGDGSGHAAAALDAAVCRAAGGPARLVARIVAGTGKEAAPWWAQARVQGTGLLTRRRRVLGGYRVLAIGDACGYVEPFTGEGMAWAVAGATALAGLLGAPGAWDGDLPARWTARHDDLVRRRQRWCGWLRPMMHRPALAAWGLAAGRAWPAAADALARHLGRPAALESP